MEKGFNGKHIWIAILVVVFIIIVISTYNKVAKQNQENAKSQASTQNTQAQNETLTYENQSKSSISGETVPKKYQEEFGSIISLFYQCCTEGDYESAYDLVSNDTKRIFYPTLNSFKDLYCKSKFKENSLCDFELWKSDNRNIYI